MIDQPSDTRSVARRVAAGTGWVIAWRLATRNLGLISTLILVRLLSPDDFGLVALAMGFVITVDALSAIGVQDALVREPSPGRDMYDAAFTINAIRGVLTAAVIACIAWPTAAFFKEPRLVEVMLALSLAMLLSAFENIGTVDFRRQLAFRAEFNLQFFSRLAGVAATIAAALLWHSYWALVVGILTTRVMRLVQSYTMCAYRPRMALGAWRRLIGFSLWTWSLAMVFQARDRADGIIIGRMLGTAQIGVFTIGSELGGLPVTEIVEPLNRTLFSGFSLLHQKAESPTRLYLDAVETAVMLILPAGIGISMVADPMVRLVLGANWLSVVPIIQIVAMASTISVFGNFSGAFLNASGKPRDSFLICIVSTFVRVPLMIWLIFTMGLPGAALAVAIALLSDQTLFLWRTLGPLGITVMDLLARVWRAVLATLAMVACLTLLGMAWTPGGEGSAFLQARDLLTRCAAGALVYGAVLTLLWFAAGRPEGAERQFLTMARGFLARRKAVI